MRYIGSSAASHVGIEWGVKGPTFGACGACSSGGHAIELGRNLIRQGQMDLAIVGASESPHTYGTMQAWEATGLLSPDGMFPFSERRNGMVLGEGAGILVLESLDHARARGAKILAELCGLATTADSTDMLSPDLDGASETMRLALEDAGLAPTEIDYVNAHGAATPAGDRVETRAIRRIFGAHAEKLAVSATKPMYGNPLGASGAIEAVICIKAMQDGWVPPTLGLDQPDPECDLDYVPNAGRQRQRRLRDVERLRHHGAQLVPRVRPAAGVGRNEKAGREGRLRRPGWLKARTAPASSAELALTRRTVTLVFAPQEHHFPVGLGSKRATRVGHELIGRHATPLTEALHVPLHLERWCCACPSRRPTFDASTLVPRPDGRTGARRRRVARSGAAVWDGTAASPAVT